MNILRKKRKEREHSKAREREGGTAGTATAFWIRRIRGEWILRSAYEQKAATPTQAEYRNPYIITWWRSEFPRSLCRRHHELMYAAPHPRQARLSYTITTRGERDGHVGDRVESNHSAGHKVRWHQPNTPRAVWPWVWIVTHARQSPMMLAPNAMHHSLSR